MISHPAEKRISHLSESKIAQLTNAVTEDLC